MSAGWPRVALRELLAAPLSNGRSVKDQPGGFPVLRLTALRDGVIDISEHKEGAWAAVEAAPFLVSENDFLVARGNGSLDLVGRGALAAKVSSPVAYPDTMIRVRVDQRKVAPRFLALAWNAPEQRRQIERLARTTAGIYKINQKHLESIDLPLPPLDEQRRIVHILEDHLSRLAAAESLVRASIVRLDALERRVIETELTGAGRSVRAATGYLPDAGVDDGVLPDLPAGWRWSRLGELADVVGGVTKDANKQSNPSYVEVPYLRVANVQRGRLDLSTVTTIRVHPDKANALRLRHGDVLLNEGGDRDKLGRGWIWEDQISECIHQNHVFRARVRDDSLDPRLLSWSANTVGGPWCEKNGKQSVNLASISLTRIKLMPVPVAPRDLQPGLISRITDALVGIDRLRAECGMALTRSVATRRALLQAAFSGQLTGHSSDLDGAEEALA